MRLLSHIVLLLSLLAAPAVAAERYVAIYGGTYVASTTTALGDSFQPVRVSYDAGYAVSGTVGVALDNGLRFENELTWRQASPRNGSDDMWAIGWLVNGWYDLRNSSAWTPYIGGGFGLGRAHVSSPGHVDHTGSGIAYQAGGGTLVKLQQNMSLDLGYRYFGVSDTSSGLSNADLVGSTFLAGVRFSF